MPRIGYVKPNIVFGKTEYKWKTADIGNPRLAKSQLARYCCNEVSVGQNSAERILNYLQF
jgi:hypothetical protein